jgi:hypothetical protein
MCVKSLLNNTWSDGEIGYHMALLKLYFGFKSQSDYHFNMKKKKVTLNEAVETLQEFARYEGCELGDYWNFLCNAFEHYESFKDSIPDSLVKEIEKTIMDEYISATTYFELVETKEMREVISKELVER